MYRSTGDIYNAFESMKKIALSQIPHFNCSGPGCFNDIDMLTVGMYDKGALHRGDSPVQTDADYKTQFALWCMLSAPLMMGGDIRNTNDFCHELLTNRELISINQDPDARQPYDFSDLVDSRALCLFKVLSNNEICARTFQPCGQGSDGEVLPDLRGLSELLRRKALDERRIHGRGSDRKGLLHEGSPLSRLRGLQGKGCILRCTVKRSA